jgi:hypothetical protein
VSDATLEERLVALGAGLRFPDADALADDVVVAIGRPAARRPRWRRPLLVAAAIVLLVSAVVVTVPDSRHAVARWLGLERLPVEVVGSLPPASRAELGPALPLADAAARAGVVPYLATTLGDPVAVHAPGGRYVAVRYDDGGTAVVVTTLPGRLDDVAFRKLVASGVQVTDVDVGDDAGVWITGEPHVFLYEARDGGIAEARPAADTLAWQEGDVIIRVEGDIPLARALAVAAGAARAELPEG